MHPKESAILAGLESLVCDLVAEGKNQPFFERLFAGRKGAWASVPGLGAGLESFASAWKRLSKGLAGNFLVTWLDYPGSLPKDGGTLVIFFLEESFWCKAAFVNRKALLRPVKKPRKA